ncbi:MAG: hypothetical protein ACI36V_06305 [Coriobacteriales bacterium]
MRKIQKVVATGISLAMATTMCVAVPVTSAFAAETGATAADGTELIDINDAIKSSYSVADQFYTGNAVKPCKSIAPKYSVSGDKLSEGKQYTVKYENNVNKGVATATLTGVESAGYTGEMKINFNIIEFTYTISLNGVKKMTFNWDQLKRLAASSIDNSDPVAYQYGTNVVYCAPKQYVTFDTLVTAAGVDKWDYADVAGTDGFTSTVNASINKAGKWWPAQTASGYPTDDGKSVPAVIAISYATASIDTTAAAAVATLESDYENAKSEDTKVLMGATEADYTAGELGGFRFATSVCTMNFVILKNNTVTVTPATKTVKNKKKSTVKLNIKKAQGEVTCTVSGPSKKVTVSNDGKVTVAKGAKAGKYTVSVTAAGDKAYKAKTVKATIKVVK